MAKENERVLAVQLRDKLTRVQGLLQCLQFVMHHPDLQLYHKRPQDDLLMTIEDIITEIDAGLESL